MMAEMKNDQLQVIWWWCSRCEWGANFRDYMQEMEIRPEDLLSSTEEPEQRVMMLRRGTTKEEKDEDEEESAEQKAQRERRA